MKKCLWSPEEDEKLKAFVTQQEISRWRDVPLQAGLERSGKSCRLRWVNHLRPGIRRGKFSAEEERLVFELQSAYGNRWSRIAKLLPGRTDNEVKNFWRISVQKSAKNYKRILCLEQQMTSYRLAVPFRVGFGEPNVEGEVQIQSPVMLHQNILTEKEWNVQSSHSAVPNMEIRPLPYDLVAESFWDMQFKTAHIAS